MKRLDVKAFAIALGILWGTTVFVLTIYCYVREGGETLVLLERIYPRYAINLRGAFYGLCWGFVHMALSGAILASLYNAFLPIERSHEEPVSAAGGEASRGHVTAGGSRSDGSPPPPGTLAPGTPAPGTPRDE